jgi:hypothetical protein
VENNLSLANMGFEEFAEAGRTASFVGGNELDSSVRTERVRRAEISRLPVGVASSRLDNSSNDRINDPLDFRDEGPLQPCRSRWATSMGTVSLTWR